MNRRGFVATVGSGLCCSLAGCASSDAEESGPEYALELIRISDDGLRAEFAWAAGDLSDEAWGVVSDALDGTARTYGHVPVRDDTLIEYGGRFYRVTVEETGRKTRERTVLRGEVVENEAAKRNSVNWMAYSGDDSTAIRHAVERSTTDGDRAEGGGQAEGDDRSGGEEFYVLRNRDPEVSDLLPEPKHEYVKYGDDVVRLATEERRLTETEYTYETTKVADSGTAFRKFVREEAVTVRFDRSKLSASQRTVFEEAKFDDYSESGDLSEGYRTLLERIFGGDLPNDTTGDHIEYEDRIYRAQLKVSGR